MLFTVYEKETEKPTTVYAVQNDKHGYPQFLVRVKHEWKWRSGKYYKTFSQTAQYGNSF